MLNKIKSYLLFGNRYTGIEHTFKNGSDSIIVSVLKQSKSEIDIESTIEVETLEMLSSELKKNQHAFLVINNEKVLTKQIESEQKEPLKLVYKAFPNIKIDDFYFEILKEKNIHFVSLCRKDYVDELIKKYIKLKLYIITISFGNSSISNLKPFIKSNEVYSSNSKIVVKDNLITKIQKSENTVNENYDLNGLTISNINLLSFAEALNSSLKSNTKVTNFESKKQESLSNFKQVRFFQQFLKFAGLFLLAGLLTNFLVFNHYFNKVNELNQISEINQSTKTKIVKLNESVSKKQKMVDDLLKSNGSKSSFFVNEIIQSLPNSIILSETNYQPLEKRIKPNKEIKLESNEIRVSGTSNNSELFSIWISQLEQKDWIEKINIESYGTESKSNSDFIIIIKLNDE